MLKQEKIKVLMIVLNNFKNDSRVIKEAVSLQNNNYDVKVVALHEDPLKEHEKMENFEVHRIKLATRSWSKNTVIQLVKYFEFLIKVVKKYRKNEVFHCHDLSALPIGVIVKLFFNKKAKVIYDAHEYETETNGLSGLRKKGAKILERVLIRYADTVITVSNMIAEEYVRLYQIQKPYLVLNTPPYREISKQDLFRKEFTISNDQNIFLYQGNLSTGRGIEILLEAFSQLSTQKNIIVFMGYGELKDTIQDIARKTPTIFFKSAVSPNVVLDYTASADFGISFIEDLCLSYRYCLPNKMFEYVMAGVPVICSDLPEMRNFIEQYQLGVVTDSITKQGIVNAIREIVTVTKKNKGKKHLNDIRKYYSWQTQEKKLLEAYCSVQK